VLPHLHVHSGYSFLDGTATVRALVERAAALGIPALALTDHDTVAGAPDLWDLARLPGLAHRHEAHLLWHDPPPHSRTKAASKALREGGKSV